ncbi:MAG: tRNA (adenosine(37)-N6)-threonylcarbamoyltransferase complex dimerization subunit type 1 TsaB [Cyclobacteriaceae bacterium]
MSLLLSIETAITVCSVCVHRDGKLMGLMELHLENIHGSKLVPAIKNLMEGLNLHVKDLDGIAVSKGPGSYTGLRIGAATAKGLAFAHQLPLIGIDTLDALAKQVEDIVQPGEFIVPMIDARRMEVYGKVLDHCFNTLVPLAPMVLNQESFGEYLNKGKVYFLGNANEKVKEMVHSPNALFLPKLNTAVTIGELATAKYHNKEFENLAYFEPNYLKEFLVMKPKKNLLLS